MKLKTNRKKEVERGEDAKIKYGQDTRPYVLDTGGRPKTI
jgi:hypothetical protein